MTRARTWLSLVLLALLAATAIAAFAIDREREEATATPPTSAGSTGLALLIVRTESGPFGAVMGSTGAGDGALVVPSRVRITIPGQGDATLGEALELPARQAATAVANLIGMWIDHVAVLESNGLVDVVDRAGGIAVGDDVLDGEETLALLEDSGDGAASAFELVVEGLLGANVAWRPPDFVEADSPFAVIETLEAVSGADVFAIPAVEAGANVFRAEPDQVRRVLVEAFGGPDRAAINVIVLNGSGVPGVGELVAERIVPDGFRIVVSQNASDFDHDETLVVVGSANDVALGERVRDLLGTGSVNVSVSSGIAPVTIVVGKDFTV